MLGHTLTAAGAINLVCTAMAIRTNQVPPTANISSVDPEIKLDVVANLGRSIAVDVAISNAFGFGGQNVSILLRR
jgi:3-oxoacyl-[acyl-carrier-protein] synthase II